MATPLHIRTLLGTHITLRTDARKIAQALLSDAPIALDFSGVEYASRSFIDELYTLITQHPHATLLHLSPDVQNKWNAVTNTRQKGRITRHREPVIINCHNMNELADMFAHM